MSHTLTHAHDGIHLHTFWSGPGYSHSHVYEHTHSNTTGICIVRPLAHASGHPDRYPEVYADGHAHEEEA